MKKILLSVVLATSLALTSCQFDDSGIWDKFGEMEESIRDHEERITALEELCKQMNTNIEALQTLVDALEKRDYVTNVAPIREDGKVVGYTISFANSDTITIYNGKDGADGQDGADGKDGYTPQIGVMKDTDGIYYWTLDGEWLLDAKGNKIQANGVNGADGTNGSNGTNGTDGVTPQLKIENDYWYVSYDNGATWEKLGNASSGSSSNCVITNVEESETEVVFTLADGSTITLPKGEKAEVVSENNKIYYTTTDGKRMFPTYTEPSYFGAMLVSNTYEDGQGVLTFDGPVTKISWTFDECSTLKTVTIPDSVTEFDRPFGDCVSLEAIYGKYASVDNRCLIVDGVLVGFAPAGLTTYTIQDGVTSIGDSIFQNCTSLESVIIPNSVTSIGGGAFGYCTSLKTITLSDNVVSFVEDAYGRPFYGCDSLTDVYINITDLAKYCTNNIMSRIQGNKHILIDNEDITNLIIPEDVTEIGNYAFSDCTSLISVTIGNGVTLIGDVAFKNCNSLATITIPGSVTEIGNSAFSGCTGELIINSKIIETDYTKNNCPSKNYSSWLYNSKFTKLTIGDSVTKIGDYAFCEYSSLTSVTIGNGVTSIGGQAFRDCTSLTRVDICDLSAWCKISFGYDANPLCHGAKLYLNGSELTEITIPSDITEIKAYAFYNCTSLTSVTIGNSVTSIENEAFAGCSSLTTITIPDSVTLIGVSAFYECSSLKSVTIGKSVTSIGDWAFFNCYQLRTVYCKPIVPPGADYEVFLNNLGEMRIQYLYVPRASVDAYKAADGWSVYADYIVGYDF